MTVVLGLPLQRGQFFTQRFMRVVLQMWKSSLSVICSHAHVKRPQAWSTDPGHIPATGCTLCTHHMTMQGQVVTNSCIYRKPEKITKQCCTGRRLIKNEITRSKGFSKLLGWRPNTMLHVTRNNPPNTTKESKTQQSCPISHYIKKSIAL